MKRKTGRDLKREAIRAKIRIDRQDDASPSTSASGEQIIEARTIRTFTDGVSKTKKGLTTVTPTIESGVKDSTSADPPVKKQSWEDMVSSFLGMNITQHEQEEIPDPEHEGLVSNEASTGVRRSYVWESS